MSKIGAGKMQEFRTKRICQLDSPKLGGRGWKNATDKADRLRGRLRNLLPVTERVRERERQTQTCIAQQLYSQKNLHEDNQKSPVSQASSLKPILSRLETTPTQAGILFREYSKKPLTRVSKRVPGVHGKRLERVGRKGWQRVGERLAKGWQRVGEGLAKIWQRVGGFPCTLQFCNSRGARLEDWVCDSMGTVSQKRSH